MAETKPTPEKTDQQPAEKVVAAGPQAPSPGSLLGLKAAPGPSASAGARKFPAVPILLAINTVLVCFIIGVILSSLPWRNVGSEPLLILHEAPAAPSTQPTSDVSTSAEMPQAVSWNQAEDAHAARNYGRSLLLYNQLLSFSESASADALTEDFFRFRVAQALLNLGRPKEARATFDKLSRSGSPIIQAAANYALAVCDAGSGQHLQARIRAYLTIAALGRVRNAPTLEADCDYLICRTLSQKVLACYGAAGPSSWGQWKTADPFTGLDEAALDKLLHEGAVKGGQSVLAPALTRDRSPEGASRWSVDCPQASIEDLLQRWATAVGTDVRWGQATPAARGRAVSLRLSEASEQRLCEVACGSVGLLARFMPAYVLVEDPQSCASLGDQRDLLAHEAGAAWRRFFLRYGDDPRMGEGHAAVAGLYDCSGDAVGALKEYQLVAHRYPSQVIAADALLAAARIRIRLRDYAGAQDDLGNLLDSFPTFPGADEVYLCLGQATLGAGRAAEAFRHFKKLYDLDLSPASQAKACLGAAECMYRQGEYEKASKWLALYGGLVKEPAGEDQARAYFLMGKCLAAQGNAGEAVAAFHLALAAKPERKQYLDTVLELARAYAAKENYAKAIGALRRIDGEKLTEEQAYQHLSLTAQTLRSMGLAEEGRTFLQDKISSVSDTQSAAMLTLELARCYQAAGNLWEARRLMGEALAKLKPGEEAWAATCDLAETCLKLGDAAQSVSITGELLKSACPAPVRRRACEILGAAYLAQKDYEKAALALSGLLAEPEGQNQ